MKIILLQLLKHRAVFERILFEHGHFSNFNPLNKKSTINAISKLQPVKMSYIKHY